jgi:hypothetical protein
VIDGVLPSNGEEIFLIACPVGIVLANEAR